MLASEHGEFLVVMRKLAGVFDRAINAELMEAYWDALRDMPLATLRRRADAHIRTGKFFPKPSELRENPDGERRIADTRSPEVDVDDWTATLNRILRDVLMATQASCSPDALRRLVAEKNRFAAQMREADPSAEEWAEIAPGVVRQLREMAA